MNTAQEIQTGIDLLQAKMEELQIVGGRVQITFSPNVTSQIYMSSDHRKKMLDGESDKFFRGTSLSDTFKQANYFLDTLPDAAEVVTREYLTRIASAVDFATENSIADEYVTPLRTVTCAMTDNLLTNRAAQ